MIAPVPPPDDVDSPRLAARIRSLVRDDAGLDRPDRVTRLWSGFWGRLAPVMLRVQAGNEEAEDADLHALCADDLEQANDRPAEPLLDSALARSASDVMDLISALHAGRNADLAWREEARFDRALRCADMTASLLRRVRDDRAPLAPAAANVYARAAAGAMVTAVVQGRIFVGRQGGRRSLRAFGRRLTDVMASLSSPDR